MFELIISNPNWYSDKVRDLGVKNFQTFSILNWSSIVVYDQFKMFKYNCDIIGEFRKYEKILSNFERKEKDYFLFTVPKFTNLFVFILVLFSTNMFAHFRKKFLL